MNSIQTSAPCDASRHRGIVFFAALAAAMSVCVILPRALVFAPMLAGLLAFSTLYCKTRTMPTPDWRFGAFLAGFLTLAALSIFWSIDQSFAIERVLKITPLFLFGFLLLAMAHVPVFTVSHQRLIAVSSVLFCSFAAMVIFFEYKLGFPLSRAALGLDAQTNDPSITGGFVLNRSLVYLVLLCMPSLLALALSDLRKSTKLVLTGILFFCLGAAFLHTKSQTAQLTALVILAMGFYPSHHKTARYFMAGAIVISILALPFLMRPAYEAVSEIKPAPGIAQKIIFEASIIHRFEVWNFISSKIQEKPLLGHGIEATRFLKSDKIMPYMATDHVLHPHNVVLQVWVEFGLLGILLSCAFAFFLLRRLDHIAPILQRYYTTLFAAILCVLSISYGLWQAWQIGMIFAIVAMSMAVSRIYGIPQEYGLPFTQNAKK